MENKTGKYLKYAIGEIVLVVIGILIALSINNWNELQKTQQQEQELYVKLLENLDSELNLIHKVDSVFRIHEDIHYNLYNTMIGKATYDPNIRYGIFRWSVNFDPTFKDNYQNKVDGISNDIIREAIIDYFKEEEKLLEKAETILDSIRSLPAINKEDEEILKLQRKIDSIKAEKLKMGKVD